jgi:hypothetical protein
VSIVAYYLTQAARLHSAADRLDRQGDSSTHANIARKKAATHTKHAETAKRWEQMANTPLAERPGGFPGDPFNSRTKCTPVQNG